MGERTWIGLVCTVLEMIVVRCSQEMCAVGESVLSKETHDQLVERMIATMRQTDRFFISYYVRRHACRGTFRGDPAKDHRRGLCYFVQTKSTRLNKIDTTWTPYRIARSSMCELTNRERSFRHHNSEYNSLTVMMFATQGFFASAPNVICCFACGTEFCDWQETESPLREHCRLVPTCVLAVALYMRIRYKKAILYGATPRNGVRVLIPPTPPPLLRRDGVRSLSRRKPVSSEELLPWTNWAHVYADEQIRLDSFRPDRWRIRRSLPAKLMARCGFVAIGADGFAVRQRYMKPGLTRYSTRPATLYFKICESDAVQCFACNYVFYDWRFEACPWTEHAFWSPKCTFICANKK